MKLFCRTNRTCLGLLSACMISLALADESPAAGPPDGQFTINVFYPGSVGIDSMIQSSVESMASPDFKFNYQPIDKATWNNSQSLVNSLISAQSSTLADGFFLACKNEDLGWISDQFRAKYPKVPFVDSFAPALLAANIVSYRYAVLTGTETNKQLVLNLIEELGIQDHLGYGGSIIFRGSYLVEMLPYSLTTAKDVSVPGVLALGNGATGSHRLDRIVSNIEAVVLAGCEGFLDIGVASEAQSQLAQEQIPVQVINPIKASIGLLDSMIRNRVWISVPRIDPGPSNATEATAVGILTN